MKNKRIGGKFILKNFNVKLNGCAIELAKNNVIYWKVWRKVRWEVNDKVWDKIWRMIIINVNRKVLE